MSYFFTKRVYDDVRDIVVLGNYWTERLDDRPGTVAMHERFIRGFGEYFHQRIRRDLRHWSLWDSLEWIRFMCDWTNQWKTRIWCYGYSSDPDYGDDEIRAILETGFVSGRPSLHLNGFDYVYDTSFDALDGVRMRAVPLRAEVIRVL